MKLNIETKISLEIVGREYRIYDSIGVSRYLSLPQSHKHSLQVHIAGRESTAYHSSCMASV